MAHDQHTQRACLFFLVPLFFRASGARASPTSVVYSPINPGAAPAPFYQEQAPPPSNGPSEQREPSG